MFHRFQSAFAIPLLLASHVFAAEPQKDAPQAWGSMTVRFVFDGPAPETKYIELPKGKGFPEKIVDEALEVDPKTRGVMNVCVWLISKDAPVHPEAVERGKETVIVNLQDHRFTPRVSIVQPGQPLEFWNLDPIEHFVLCPILGGPPAAALLNRHRRTLRVVFPKHNTSPTYVSDSLHPWMKGFVACTASPYAASSDVEGRLKISDLPVGEWEFRMWHEGSGWLVSRDGKFRVKIEPGKTTDLGEVKLDSKEFPHLNIQE